MKRIYVAGAYSDTNVISVLKNIGRGQHFAARLFQLGFAPFAPWFDKEFIIHQWWKDFDVDKFYKYSLEWLKVSDAVFVVPNRPNMKDWQQSLGTKKEIEEATKLDIPVFYDLDYMVKYFKNEQSK